MAAALSALVNMHRVPNRLPGGDSGQKASPLTITPASTARSGRSDGAGSTFGGVPVAQQQHGEADITAVPAEVLARARCSPGVGNLLRTFAAARKASTTELLAPEAAARHEQLLRDHGDLLRTVLCIQ